MPAPCRVFDLGCGNGALARWLDEHGFSVTGVDPSKSGVEIARAAAPHIPLFLGSSDDELCSLYGTFPLVISLEVVEHVFSAQTWARCVAELLEPGGRAIISTPYHGYLKNLVIALVGGFDRHVNPVRDGGHIKFWSRATLSQLLTGVGLRVNAFHRVGRIPWLAKSMIATAQKPQ